MPFTSPQKKPYNKHQAVRNTIKWNVWRITVILLTDMVSLSWRPNRGAYHSQSSYWGSLLNLRIKPAGIPQTLPKTIIKLKRIAGCHPPRHRGKLTIITKPCKTRSDGIWVASYCHPAPRHGDSVTVPQARWLSSPK